MIKYITILLLVTSLQAEIPQDLINALVQVESNGDTKAVGDKGNARGVLQLWAIYIEDVNRIYKTNYTHDDAWHYNNSCEITELYLTHYGKHYEKMTGKKATRKVLARIHNGGPSGYKKKATLEYWDKVFKVLNKTNIYTTM